MVANSSRASVTAARKIGTVLSKQRHKPAFLLGLLGLLPAAASASVIAQYDVTTGPNTGASTIATAAGVTGSQLARGSYGAVPGDSTHGYAIVNQWSAAGSTSSSTSLVPASTDYSTAQTKGSYFEFTLTPSSNTTLDITNVTIETVARNYANFGYGLFSSADGFTNLLGSGVNTNAGTGDSFTTLSFTFSDIITSSPLVFSLALVNSTSNQSYLQGIIDHGSVAVTPAIVVNGTVTPEPTSLGLVAMGIAPILLRRRRQHPLSALKPTRA